jgi:hypothetical protein
MNVQLVCQIGYKRMYPFILRLISMAILNFELSLPGGKTLIFIQLIVRR